MKKGFTLIELVIVIGILAVLAAVVVLVLNPAELMKQARDSQRLSDMNSIKSAIALYLATATTPAMTAGPFTTASTTTFFSGAPAATVRNIYAVDGTGWVAINLASTTGGSALGILPSDPTNIGTTQYYYKADANNLVYEIDTVLESVKYATMMTADGGDSASVYETGTKSGLNL